MSEAPRSNPHQPGACLQRQGIQGTGHTLNTAWYSSLVFEQQQQQQQQRLWCPLLPLVLFFV